MTEVDNRVVSMDFDNQRFEEGVKTSLGTIQKLNGVLDNLDKIDFSGLESAIQGMSSRLTNAGLAAATFISNITNRVTDSAIRMVKSLTIDNVSSGFANYETELKSVQNIMNATGDDMSTVETELGRIRTYTDETSYSYSKMVETLSTFTSQKIPLQESADAVMGIANMLALSGVEAGKSEHAFSGFAKALAAGMSGQTWAYIQTAGANTAQTKEILLDAAVAVGTLERAEDGLLKTTEKASKAGQAVDINNFEQTFSYDWLSTEALVHAFEDMGFYSTLLDTFIKKYKDIAGETITVSDAMEMLDNKDSSKVFDSATLEAYAASMEEMTGTAMTAEEALSALQNREETLSEKGYKAGQAYRTFADAINATKTAVTSSLGGIFKSVFGNAEQAKETWTAVGTWMYDIFDAPFVNLDEMLSSWAKGSGREKFMHGFYTIGDAIVSVINATREGFAQIIPPIAVSDVNRLAENFENLAHNLKPTEGDLEKVRSLSEKVGKVFSSLVGNVKTIGSSIKKAFKNVIPQVTLDSLNNFAENLVSMATSFSISEETSQKLTNAFEGLFAIVDIVRLAFEGISRNLHDNIGIFKKVGDAVLDGSSNFGQLLKSIRDTIAENDTFYNGIKKVIDFIRPGFEKVETAISNALKSIQELLGVDFKIPASLGDFTETISTAFKNLKEKVSPVTDVFHGLFDIIQSLVGYVFDALGRINVMLTNFSDTFTKFKDALVQKLVVIRVRFQKTFGEIDFKKVGALLLGIFTRNITWENTWLFHGLQGIRDFFNEDVGGKLKDLVGKIKSGIEDFGGILEGISEIFTRTKDGMLNFLETFQNTQMTQQIRNMAISLLMIAGAMWILASIEGDPVEIFTKLAEALVGLAAIYKIIEKMMTGLSGSLKGAANLGALSIAFVGLAAACLILAFALKLISTIPTDGLEDRLLALIGILGAVTIAIYALATNIKGQIGSILAAAGALLIVSFAIINLSIGLLLLSLVPTDNLGASFLVLIGTIAILALAIFGLGEKMKASIPSMLAAAAALVIASFAILVLAASFAILALIPSESVWGSFEAMAVMIIILAAALAILGGLGPVILAAGGALLMAGIGIFALSASLIPLAAGLALLNQFKGWDLVKLAGCMILLAIGLAVLGAAGVVLLVGGPGLLMGANALVKIGEALLLMNGTGVAAQGLSFLLLAVGLTALAVAGMALLIGGAGLIIGGKGLVQIGTALTLMNGTGVAAQGLSFLLLAVGLTALAVAGMALQVGGEGLILGGSALTKLAGALIVFSSIGILTAGVELKTLAKSLNDLAGAGILLIPASVGLIAAGAALIEMGMGFKKANNALTKIAELDLTNACKQLKNLSETVTDYKSVSKDFKKYASNLRDGFEEAFRQALGMAMEGSYELIDVTGFKTVGTNIVEQITSGMTSSKGSIGSTGRSVVASGVAATSSGTVEYRSVGQNIIRGIIDGMESMRTLLIQSVNELAFSIPRQFNAVLQIYSPSRVMARESKYVPLGVAQGIQNGIPVAVGSMEKLTDSLVSSAKNSVDRITYAMNLEDVADITPVTFGTDWDSILGVDFTNPEITPHLNLDPMRREIAAMQDLMDGNITADADRAGSGNVYNTFNQYNSSPKSLSRIEIYRQTKNLLSLKS